MQLQLTYFRGVASYMRHDRTGEQDERTMQIGENVIRVLEKLLAGKFKLKFLCFTSERSRDVRTESSHSQ